VNDEGSAALFARAQRVTPGGVKLTRTRIRRGRRNPRFNRPRRGPVRHRRRRQPLRRPRRRVGTALLGHAHPAVVDAVRAASERGFGFGIADTGRVGSGRAHRRPLSARSSRCASSTPDRSDDERAAPRPRVTGRSKVVKFAGCYHGHVDALLASAGSGVATSGCRTRRGSPARALRTIVLPYNDISAVVRRSTCTATTSHASSPRRPRQHGASSRRCRDSNAGARRGRPCARQPARLDECHRLPREPVGWWGSRASTSDCSRSAR